MAVLTLVAAAGVGLIGGNKGILQAHAQAPSATQVATQKADAETADNTNTQADTSEQKPSYTSSIKVVDTTEQDEKTEAAKLASLAKITSDQAKAAAEKNIGGAASSVKLESENGNVVYVVTIGTKEVKVDAGNGNVLHTATAEAGDSGETGSAESN